MIKKELGFAKYEFQLKARASVSEKDLLKLGARKLGSVIHEDKYFTRKGKLVSDSNELIRIRKEGGETLSFTYKGPIANRRVRNRLVVEKPIKEKELSGIKKEFNEVIAVNKKRTVFLLGKVLVFLDKVEHLGDFIEFEAQKKQDAFLIDALVKRLGISQEKLSRLSYFELALMNSNALQRILYKMHEKMGGMSFGISSAVLTTLGMIIGLNSATDSLLAVIGGIAAVAVADSLSDAMGMYASKKSERGTSSLAAFRGAANTFASKIVFTLSFMIPFMLLPIMPAIYASIAWGLILLSFVSIQIAFIQEENTLKAIAKNWILAFIIIALAYLAGKAVTLIA